MEMLRLATAGSVDDGKSTLIGRLLYDSKSIFEDQLESVERTSRQRGEEYTNLALLTDGLRAEREQGITIDVAYRYFATPRRKFIIADTPGHVQYTRNMVTGRVHGQRRADPGGRPQGCARAEPPARVPGLAAAGTAPGAVREQDGSGRLRPGRLRKHPRRVQGVRGQARHRRPDHDPDFGAQRRQRRQQVAEHALVRGRARCCTTWRTCTSPATATSSTCASRCSTWCGPCTTPSTTTGGTPARSRPACSSPATRSWSCPAG